MALEARFDLPPERALKFFRGKGFATSFAWQDVWQQEHAGAFTVAKMMQVDLLRDVQMAVDKAIAEGWSAQMFIDALKPRLIDAGWWGVQTVVDPLTGREVEAQLGSPRRLRHIYRQNMMSAYSAGHWAEIQESKESAPYLLYDAVQDELTRDEHAAWDGTVLPVDDAWWSTHMPPNGHNCRCGVIQLGAGQVEEHGFKVADKAPPIKTREWTNPRTGAVERVPEGIDPGFAYNPGASQQDLLQKQLDEKRRLFRDGR